MTGTQPVTGTVFCGDVMVPTAVYVAENSAGLPELDLVIGDQTFVVTVLDAFCLAAALEDGALRVFRSQDGET